MTIRGITLRWFKLRFNCDAFIIPLDAFCWSTTHTRPSPSARTWYVPQESYSGQWQEGRKISCWGCSAPQAHGEHCSGKGGGEVERQKKQAARDQRDTEEAERQRLWLTRDPNYAFFGSLGSKLKPDLVDIAHALKLRQITHPGKEKLTKKKIQDFIEAHFDSNPEKREDLRFEGLFNACRRPRTDENSASGANATASAPPSIHFSTHPQAPSMLPLPSNISNIIWPAPLPVLGPSQPHPHSQFPHPNYPLVSALALLPLILMYHIPTLILTIRTPRILQVKRRQLMPFHALYIIESLVTRTFYISPLYFFCTYFNTHNVSYAIPTSIIVLNFRGCHSSCKRNPRHDANAMRGLKWQCDMSWRTVWISLILGLSDAELLCWSSSSPFPK